MSKSQTAKDMTCADQPTFPKGIDWPYKEGSYLFSKKDIVLEESGMNLSLEFNERNSLQEEKILAGLHALCVFCHHRVVIVAISFLAMIGR